jgi:hypothetical protein
VLKVIQGQHKKPKAAVHTAEMTGPLKKKKKWEIHVPLVTKGLNQLGYRRGLTGIEHLCSIHVIHTLVVLAFNPYPANVENMVSFL